MARGGDDDVARRAFLDGVLAGLREPQGGAGVQSAKRGERRGCKYGGNRAEPSRPERVRGFPVEIFYRGRNLRGRGEPADPPFRRGEDSAATGSQGGPR